MNVLAWLAILVSATSSPADLIGSKVPPYPDGLKELGGTCIGSASRGLDHVCDHSIGILGNADNEARILYGARLVGRNESESAIWEITDAMEYPRLSPGQTLVIATCTIDGKDASSIMAAVNITDTEWYESIVWARRYNFESGTFIKQPTAGMRCYNEGWGL